MAFLVEQFSSRDPERRLFAAELLGIIGPRAMASTGKLVAILADRHEPAGLRLQAAIALSRIDPDSARVVPALVEAIDEAPAVAIRALFNLGPRAAAAVPRLVALLGVDDKNVVEPPSHLALLALPQIDPEGLRCLPAVIHAFESHMDESRPYAAHAAGGVRSGLPERAFRHFMRGFLVESEIYAESAFDAIHDSIGVALRRSGRILISSFPP